MPSATKNKASVSHVAFSNKLHAMILTANVMIIGSSYANWNIIKLYTSKWAIIACM